MVSSASANLIITGVMALSLNSVVRRFKDYHLWSDSGLCLFNHHYLNVIPNMTLFKKKGGSCEKFSWMFMDVHGFSWMFYTSSFFSIDSVCLIINI